MKLIELQAKCAQLGLDPIPTKRRRNPDRYELSINDCTKAIREYYVNKLESEGNLDSNLLTMLEIESPMLASLVKQQSNAVQKEVWNDYSFSWQFQRKYDGIRFLMFYNSKDNKVSFYSRSISEETMLPIEYSSYFDLDLTNLKVNDFILDLEMIYKDFEDYQIDDIKTLFEDIVVAEGKFSKDKFKFVVLDCLMFDSKWVLEDFLSSRYNCAINVLNGLKMAEIGYIFESVDIKPNNITKEAYYYSIIDNEGEGVIAKLLDSPYETKRSNYWLKIKPKFKETLNVNLRDTVDAFVSGYLINDETQMIDTLLFSVFLDGKQVLVNRLYLSQELQNKVTGKDDLGNIILKIGFDCAVGEFSFDLLNDDYLMLHPKLLSWRIDKSFRDCVYTSEYFKSLM